MRLVMQRDGIAQDEVHGLIERVRAGLRRVTASGAQPSEAASAA